MTEMSNVVRKLQKRKTALDSDGMVDAFNSFSKHIEKKIKNGIDSTNSENELFGRSIGEKLKQIKNIKNKYQITRKIMILSGDALL